MNVKAIVTQVKTLVNNVESFPYSVHSTFTRETGLTSISLESKHLLLYASVKMSPDKVGYFGTNHS